MLNNKRAQIGETMTWIVATLVIVVILGISVFVAFPLKDLGGFKFDRKADLLATKSLVNYLGRDEAGETLYEKLKEGGKLGVGDKAAIENLYQDDYNGGAQLDVRDRHDPAVVEVTDEVKCQVDIRAELNDEKDILFCLGSGGADEKDN